MKAILIINMPECCAECPLDYDTMNCLGMDEYMETMGYDGKPEWCPLRPMPQRKLEWNWGSGAREWNACLDEIMGD